MRFENLVSNWSEFEELVRSICETGNVTVERDVVLVGKSGAPRQIDVVMKATHGLTNHLVVVECKYWKRPVTRQNVDSLSTALLDLNASKGIIFSSAGFQEGAIALAKHNGIDLFKVRSLEPSEQFGPATPLSAYRNYLWRSIRNLEFPGIHCWERDLSAYNIAINLGGIPGTVVRNTSDYPSGSVEGIIESWSFTTACDLALQAKQVLFNGQGGVRRFWNRVKQTADAPIELEVDGSIAIIPVIRYDLGITIWQEPYELDKNAYKFIVAVEDCILGIVHKASRESASESTKLEPAADRLPQGSKDPLSYTQKILFIDGWMPFDFDGMEKRKYYDTPGFPEFIKAEWVAEWRNPS